MTIQNKVLALFVTCLLQAASLEAAVPSSVGVFETFSASEKGIEILGTILNNRNTQQNIVLIKKNSSKQTQAISIGSTLTLDESYLLTAVSTEYIEVQGARRKLRLYKYGFAPLAQAKAKVIEQKVEKISGSYKEDGFERIDENIKITEEYRKKVLEKDLPKILMQAAAEAKTDSNGNITGFGIYDIEKDSVFQKIGMIDGDVVKSINGNELNSAAGAIKLLNDSKTASSLNIMIERGGQVIPLNLDVK